jgi:GTP cyclohydrolase I
VEKAVKPEGVGCVVEGFHLCMAMRGVQKQRAVAVTSSYRGVFQADTDRRRELTEMLRSGRELKY